VKDVRDRKSDFEVLKSTSLFGGVQVLTILFAFIRTKVISVVLGPAGLGIINIISGTLGLIEVFLVGGIQSSAVRQIAVEYENRQPKKLDEIIIVVKRVMLFAALLGVLFVLIASFTLHGKYLDGGDGTIFLGAVFVVFLNIMNARNIIFLQGMRKLKKLAMSTIISGFISTTLVVLLYFNLDSKALLPGIYISSIAPFLVTSFYTRRLTRVDRNIDILETLKGAGIIVKLGFAVSFASLCTHLVGYLTRITILNLGDLTSLGLYSAGFAIIGSYVGLFFTALGTDYLPRLSMGIYSITEMNNIVGKQIEIGLLILSPMLVVFVFFYEWLINLMYSPDFSRISGMLIWSSIGVIFKLSSWAISFIFIAKGMQRTFLLNELVAGLYFVFFNFIGYYWKGLDGLGLSSTLCYLIYFFQVYFIAVQKCDLAFHKSTIKSLSFHLTLVILAVIIELFFVGYTSLASKLVVVFISFVYLMRKFSSLAGFKLAK
jgi:O-antigen/teichoic acid export membrane protein